MQEQATTQETAQPTPEGQIGLQLGDIVAATQLIQVASTRGAFRAEEFTQVGAVYDRLLKFLKDSGAIQPASDAPAEQPAV